MNEGVKMKTQRLKMIGFKVNESLRQQLLAMDNTSEFIRGAIIEKMIREGMTVKNGKQ